MSQLALADQRRRPRPRRCRRPRRGRSAGASPLRPASARASSSRSVTSRLIRCEERRAESIISRSSACPGACSEAWQQLEVGEDAGQRRAQLVRGVGDELALLLHRAPRARRAPRRASAASSPGCGPARRPRRRPWAGASGGRGRGCRRSGGRSRSARRSGASRGRRSPARRGWRAASRRARRRRSAARAGRSSRRRAPRCGRTGRSRPRSPLRIEHRGGGDPQRALVGDARADRAEVDDVVRWREQDFAVAVEDPGDGVVRQREVLKVRAEHQGAVRGVEDPRLGGQGRTPRPRTSRLKSSRIRSVARLPITPPKTSRIDQRQARRGGGQAPAHRPVAGTKTGGGVPRRGWRSRRTPTPSGRSRRRVWCGAGVARRRPRACGAGWR